MKSNIIRAAFFVCVSMAVAIAAAKPIVVYNEDDSNFIGGDGMAFSNYLNSICRGTVTHFLFCPNSMRSNIGTKSIEPIWKALEEPWAKPDGRCPAFKRLHDAGIDPYRFYIDAARAKGVSPGISMRMNDHHWVTEPDYCALSDFWRAHPEFRREQTKPQKGRWNWDDYNFDYAHKEVRDYFLAYVAELLERYDVDVFECDWLRTAMCLRAGREAADAHFISEFMREVRMLAAAAAQRRGHPVKVSVRVCPVIATNQAIGYDVLQWVRDGSVDWVVGCNDWDCANFDIDVAGWEAEISKTGRDVLFIPGLDRNIRESYAPDSAKHNLSRAEYFAWCDGVFAKGAKGVYLFNLFGIERSRGVWDAALDGDILPPKCGAYRRVYPIWYDDLTRSCYPKSLAEAACEIKFFVGTTQTKGGITFRCAFTGCVTEKDAGRFTLNGCLPLGVTQGSTHAWSENEGRVESEWDVFYPVSAIRSGYNRISLPQLKDVAFTSGCLELDPKGTHMSQVHLNK